jgi:hypothetical protein
MASGLSLPSPDNTLESIIRANRASLVNSDDLEDVIRWYETSYPRFMKPSNASTEVCFNGTEVTIASFQASTTAQHLFSVLFLLPFPYCSSTFFAPLRNRLCHHVLDTTVSHGVLQIVPSMQSSFSLG